jgi:spore coat protein CotF
MSIDMPIRTIQPKITETCDDFLDEDEEGTTTIPPLLSQDNLMRPSLDETSFDKYAAPFYTANKEAPHKSFIDHKMRGCLHSRNLDNTISESEDREITLPSFSRPSLNREKVKSFIHGSFLSQTQKLSSLMSKSVLSPDIKTFDKSKHLTSFKNRKEALSTEKKYKSPQCSSFLKKISISKDTERAHGANLF